MESRQEGKSKEKISMVGLWQMEEVVLEIAFVKAVKRTLH